MVRKIWLFLSTLCLLFGLELFLLQSFVLTSESTEFIAQQDESIERKRWWFEALVGEELRFPEKEIAVKPVVSYGLLFVAGIGFFHCAFCFKQ